MTLQEIAFLATIGAFASIILAAFIKIVRGQQRIVDRVDTLKNDQLETSKILAAVKHDFEEHISLGAKLHIDKLDLQRWQDRIENKMDRLLERSQVK